MGSHIYVYIMYIMIYGGVLSHRGYPESSKSLDHGLVLKPMVTWGNPIRERDIYMIMYKPF